MTRLVCIASGKGGVGKTTSVVNIGTALSKAGYDTIIVDANIPTPNLSIHLGLTGGKTIHDVLSSKADILEVVKKHSSGLKVITGGLSLWKSKNANKKSLSSELSKLKGKCDVVLLDCSPGINDESSDAIKSAEELFVITNPSLPALTDALKTVELARTVGTVPKGIILNMQRKKGYELSINNVEEFLGLPVIAIVPEDDKVRKSLAKRSSVIESFPKSKASKSFVKAAAEIIGADHKQFKKKALKKKGWFFK